MMKIFAFCVLAALALLGDAQAAVRIKDLVEVEGVRGNDLVGYGLVVGLDGAGDGIRNSPYTEEAFSNLLERLGVNVQGEDFKSKNIAAVLVTATLPAFARPGAQIDVSVSAIGDAQNLLGGTLIMTPLRAADGEIYAVAQGAVIAGGVSAQGAAASVTFGAPTAGAIPQGARVERSAAFDFSAMEQLRLMLKAPDATTAVRIENAINDTLGPRAATVADPGVVDIKLSPDGLAPIRVMSIVENLWIEPQQKARVVIDQKSGTVVLGADVKISQFAVAQGNLTISVRENYVVSQPNPFSRNGETIVVPNTQISVDQDRNEKIGLVDGNVSLADLIEGLNALGVGPRDLIDILKTIKAAGALHAELVVM